MPHVPYETETGTAQVWWESTGSGDPLVLVNGLSSPSDVWFRVVPRLSPHYRVITVDNLGVGRTEFPPGPWTVATLAGGVAAALEAAGVSAENPAHVLGISLGGMISQELVFARPELVRSLVFVATHAGFAHAESEPAALEAIMTAGSLAGEDRYAALAPFTHAPSCPPERLAEDMAVRASRPTSEEGYTNQLRSAGSFDSWDRLPGIDRPTLVLHGALDQLVKPVSGERLAARIPDAKLVLLPECGHQLFTDQPVAGTDAVLEFLAGAGAGAGVDGTAARS